MRKRSKYRPRAVLVDPLGWTLERCATVASRPGAVTLKIIQHDALMAVTRGVATRKELDTLIGALNTAEALCAVNETLGKDFAQDIRSAQDALLSMCRRGTSKGSFVFTGEELAAVNLGMEIHDAQLDACTIFDLDQAHKYINRQLRAKKYRSVYEQRAEV